MNIRYDETVHAIFGGFVDHPAEPVCGTAMVPACAPELTDDPVDCWECKSITD